MFKKAIYFFLLVSIFGCSTTYKPPPKQPGDYYGNVKRNLKDWERGEYFTHRPLFLSEFVTLLGLDLIGSSVGDTITLPFDVITNIKKSDVFRPTPTEMPAPSD